MSENGREELVSNVVGAWITRVSIGDWWVLSLSNGKFLVASLIEAIDASAILLALTQVKPGFMEQIVDLDVCLVGVLLHKNMHKPVTSVSLRDDASFVVCFEGGDRVVVASSAKEVDWQWGINVSGRDPHLDHIVACFDAGSVELNSKR